MCGPSGSGKSTWARRYRILHPRTEVVSTDAIREELFGDASVQSNPQKVFGLAHKKLKKWLDGGHNVIFDAMNLSPKDRRAIIAEYRRMYPTLICICVVMRADIDKCVEHQNMRARKVSSDVIKKQFNRFQRPTLDEGWDIIATDNTLLI